MVRCCALAVIACVPAAVVVVASPNVALAGSSTMVGQFEPPFRQEGDGRRSDETLSSFSFQIYIP